MLNKKRFIKSLFTAILSLSICSCVPHDLGSYTTDDEYIEAFGDIKVLDKDLSSEGYDMSDFYYDELGTELDGATGIDNYTYMFIEAGKEMMVEELYLYIHGDEAVDSVYVNLELSTVLSIPSNLRGYDDPDTKTVEDDEGETHEEPIQYDKIEPLDKSGVTVYGSKWTSFHFKPKDSVFLNSGEHLVIKFLNNTYEGKVLGYQTCKFELTGLFIRAL